VFMFCHPEVTMYLLVYVDDIILVSSSVTAASRLVQDLRSAFAVKDLGPLHYFLGIEVSTLFNGFLHRRSMLWIFFVVPVCFSASLCLLP
jgi:hypothetical protein